MEKQNLLDELFKMNGMNVTKELRDITIIEKEVQTKANILIDAIGDEFSTTDVFDNGNAMDFPVESKGSYETREWEDTNYSDSILD
tara:strand:+ start:75 stop:332 length:258 start_codon:yes stop_codon:yes gene_type:complete